MVFGPVAELAALDVAENGQLAGHGHRAAVGKRLLPAGDVIEDQLRDVGVVADDDEDRRREAVEPVAVSRVLASHAAVVLLVVGVQALERAFQLDGELRLAVDAASVLRPFLGRSSPDARPEVAVGGLSPVIESSATGTRGTLTMPALDGVDQREVGHDPGEQRALAVARAAEEERRGREVVDGLDAELALDCLQAPKSRPGPLRRASRLPCVRRR